MQGDSSKKQTLQKSAPAALAGGEPGNGEASEHLEGLFWPRAIPPNVHICGSFTTSGFKYGWTVIAALRKSGHPNRFMKRAVCVLREMIPLGGKVPFGPAVRL
jgi:hypothetical protein